MIGAYGLHQDQGSCLGRYVRSQDMLKASMKVRPPLPLYLAGRSGYLAAYIQAWVLTLPTTLPVFMVRVAFALWEVLTYSLNPSGSRSIQRIQGAIK